MTTDLTFFTNEPDAALLDRFKATLRDVQFFDVLVGYFRTSGFHLLVDALAEIEQIRILVGLGVDRQALEIIEASGQQLELAFQSARQTKDLFAELQRVDWPNREKVVSSTVTVVVISIFIGLFLWLADLGLTWVMQRVLPHT